MALNSGTSAAGYSGWVVYYRGPRIHVTNHDVETVDGRYRVRDLDLVTRVEYYRHPARTIAMIVSGVELAAGLVLAVFLGAAVLIGVALLIAAGLAGAVILDGRRNPRWMELRAVHRGREILLFSSRDQQEFERVRWAVSRAVGTGRR
jgi:uncharacterized protein DUF6232